MYLLDFGNIQFTDNNVKDKIEYTHQINPDGDMLLGIASMAELKFTLYDLNNLITDADITGREFAFKKSKTSTYVSKWDIFKLTKPDIMCFNGDTVYSVKKNVFSINGKAVTAQPTEAVQCIYIVNSKAYLGHASKVSVYTLTGARQADITLTAFQQTQIIQGASLNMQGDTLKEYSTRLFDMKPVDFIEKTSVFTQVGIFIAVTPERKNKTNISVTSYDRMYKFSGIADTLINSFAYPVTAYNLLNALCQNVSVPLATASITNGSYPITKKFSVSNTTFRTILQYIAELSGNFAYVDNIGRMVVRFYEATAKVYKGDNFKTIRQLEFTTAKIDKVQVKTSADDVGVIVPKSETKPNAYVIENNPLMYTSSDAELRPYVQALFDKLKNFQYIPTEFTTVLDNDFEGHVGELVSINGTQVPVFIKRIKGLIETYSCSGNATRNTQTTRLNEAVKMLNGKTSVIIDTVDEFSVTLKEVKTGGEENTAQLKIQANQISTEVTRATETEGLLNSKILQTASEISLKVSKTDYNGNTIASLINQTATTIDIQASKINLTGYATFNNLKDGVTTISGSNVKTGTIDASKVTVTNLNASYINAGSLSADRISGGTLQGVEVISTSGGYSVRLGNGQVTFGSGAYINGQPGILYISSTSETHIRSGSNDAMVFGTAGINAYRNIYSNYAIQASEFRAGNRTGITGSFVTDTKLVQVVGGIIVSIQ